MSEIRRTRDTRRETHTAPDRQLAAAPIPASLLGDWRAQNGTINRFNYDGDNSVVETIGYSIDANDGLHYAGETWARTAGANGIMGAWRFDHADGYWESVTFGARGFYCWTDSLGGFGGGSFVANAVEIFRIEKRADVVCAGNTITFTSPERTFAGTFVTAGDTLTITLPEGVESYTRVPMF